ncbi:MAG: PilZ domain-containing protein [Candidatus Sulfotelmatobacter sp.]
MGEAIAEVRPAAEKRRFRRFRLECPVRVRFPSERDPSSAIDTVSRNLSIGGLLLESPLPIPESQAVEFTITLQGGLMVRPVLLVGTGEVVRVETGEAKDRFGIAVACSLPIGEIEDHLSGTVGQAD